MIRQSKLRSAKANLRTPPSLTAAPGDRIGDGLNVLERVCQLQRYDEWLFKNNEHGEYVKRVDVIRAVVAGDAKEEQR